MKIGAISIGQSPRDDIIEEIRPLFGSGVEILQAGALDGMTRAEIDALAPKGDEYSLVAKLGSGDSVILVKEHILPLMTKRAQELEAQGAEIIILLCAGVFPDIFKSNVPIIQPVKMLYAIAPLLSPKSRIIDVLPDASQQQVSTENWLKHVKGVDTVIASPYKGEEQLIAAAEKARTLEGDIIVLDCIGFTMEIKRLFEKHSGKHVILSKSLVARVISEITG